MQPITLRLPDGLVSELDEEADDTGFSSRSEYIRHLLQKRKDTSELFSSEVESNRSEQENLHGLRDTVIGFGNKVIEVQERVEALETTVEQLKSERPQTVETVEESSNTESILSNNKLLNEETSGEQPPQEGYFSELFEWLDTDGLDHDNPTLELLLLITAQILADEGPLSASELKKRILDRHPNIYNEVDTYSESPIERFYQDVPGFLKLKSNKYAYNPEYI